MIAVACGCIMILVLAGGIGIGVFALVRSSDDGGATADPAPENTATTEADPGGTDPASQAPPTDEPESQFEVIAPHDRPPGDPEELAGVLQNNPLTEGSLPGVGTCDLPETPVDHDMEQLQALLDAAVGCLNTLWSTANSNRNLPSESTQVVVYEHPDIPDEACNPDNFSADSPTVCNLERTIFWPMGAGFGAQQTDPEQVATAYLVDLARVYGVRVMWSSSVAIYYVQYRELVEEDEPELFGEALRRYSLQLDCWAAAAAMRMPSGAQPSAQTRAYFTDPEMWTDRASTGVIAPESRTRWMQAGFDSGGDLSACNTWAAPADQVV